MTDTDPITQAAAEAISGFYGHTPYPHDMEEAELVVAAVAPLIRQQIANQIKVQQHTAGYPVEWVAGMNYAAKIAQEGQQ